MNPEIYAWLLGGIGVGTAVACGPVAATDAPRRWPSLVGLCGLIAALLAVGVESGTLVRHVVQIAPAMLALALVALHSPFGRASALAILPCWLALMVTILVADDALADPFRAVLGMPALWLLVSFIGFLLWVPNWAGPRALDIGLSVVAALAAIIVIAVGFTMHGASSDASLVERTIAGMVAAVPSADWIGVGVFVTALAGVMAGRLLPEAE